MTKVPALATSEIERVFREEYGRAVAVLVRVFGDIDVAEEAVQDAFTAAVQRWPSSGLPPSPAGWIITTARNRAIDRLRREASRDDRHAQAALLHAGGEPAEEDVVGDDRLRLIFTCCHPALAPGAQVALTLRLLGGLTTAEIARAFLVPETTMAQRLVRAKGRSATRKSRTRVPTEADLPGRLRAVLAVIYLIFNEGYTASSGDRLIREDLCAEAIRLGRLLAELMPGEPEVLGLLALMLLIESRRAARLSPDGDLVLLADQDRAPLGSRAHRRRPGASSGTAFAATSPARTRSRRRSTPSTATRRPRPPRTGGRSCSCTTSSCRSRRARSSRSTAPSPSPRSRDRHAALALVDGLDLDRYYLFHAIRADLLRRLGRHAEAALAYEAAIARCENATERDFLQRRRQALT